MNFQNVDEILEYAIGKEKEAVTFYTDLKEKASSKSLKETFHNLAQEEANHVKLLTKISKNQEVIASYKEEKVKDLKISDYMVEKEYEEGMPMQDILVLAMKREEAAVKLYKDLVERSENDESAKLFKLLAQEEAEHKYTFEKMYDDTL